MRTAILILAILLSGCGGGGDDCLLSEAEQTANDMGPLKGGVGHTCSDPGEQP